MIRILKTLKSHQFLSNQDMWVCLMQSNWGLWMTTYGSFGFFRERYNLSKLKALKNMKCFRNFKIAPLFLHAQNPNFRTLFLKLKIRASFQMYQKLQHWWCNKNIIIFRSSYPHVKIWNIIKNSILVGTGFVNIFHLLVSSQVLGSQEPRVKVWNCQKPFTVSLLWLLSKPRTIILLLFSVYELQLIKCCFFKSLFMNILVEMCIVLCLRCSVIKHRYFIIDRKKGKIL